MKKTTVKPTPKAPEKAPTPTKTREDSNGGPPGRARFAAGAPPRSAPAAATRAVKPPKIEPVPVPPAPPTQRRMRVNYTAPGARRVFVAGSFNEWEPEATPLKAYAGGEWRVELFLLPGRYEYLFVVDGQWMADPSAAQSASNPFGGVNSVLVVT